MQRDGEEPDRHLLAGGGDDVELAARRIGGDFLGEREQAIGLARHRRHDDDDLVTLAVEVRHATRDVLDAVGRADRRAAVFLDDEGHCEMVRTTRGTRASRWCPPKPNEFESAPAIFILRATLRHEVEVARGIDG